MDDSALSTGIAFPDGPEDLRPGADAIVSFLAQATQQEPRHSEGDIIALPDGRILAAYSRYHTGEGQIRETLIGVVLLGILVNDMTLMNISESYDSNATRRKYYGWTRFGRQCNCSFVQFFHTGFGPVDPRTFASRPHSIFSSGSPVVYPNGLDNSPVVGSGCSPVEALR